MALFLEDNMTKKDIINLLETIATYMELSNWLKNMACRLHG